MLNPTLASDCGYQCGGTEDSDCAFHVVGEDVKAHLGSSAVFLPDPFRSPPLCGSCVCLRAILGVKPLQPETPPPATYAPPYERAVTLRIGIAVGGV